MTPFEFQECLDDIREAQRIVVLQLSGWLRGRSGAALKRLGDARAREGELFRIVLAGLEAGKVGRPRKASEHERPAALDG